MASFEYKVVPAPSQGTKAKGIKSTEDRFALSMTEALNAESADGWEYVRAETLPCDERKGLTGTQTTYQNMLVFRRLVTDTIAEAPKLPPLELGAPTHPAPVHTQTAIPDPVPQRADPPLSRFPRTPSRETDSV